MVLAYHQIVTQPCPYRYSLDATLFDDHMSMAASLKDRPTVTFDDGHISQYLYALRSLERHGVQAIFFVTAGWVGREHYMGWTKLRELQERGHQIQSHGWSHKMLLECSRAELREELRRSKSVLETRLGTPVKSLSCPGGAWSATVLEACAEVGYTSVYTSEAWASPLRENGVEVTGRLMVCRNCSGANLHSLIKAEQQTFAASRLQFAITRAARRVLGIRRYHSLWCRIAKWSPETDAVR